MTYTEKKSIAIREFNLLKKLKEVSLTPKKTGHFFRKRKKVHRLDLRFFNEVIAVRPENGYVETEGLVRFDALLDATLKYGYMPAVVPEMRSITIGGAISGLGVEATSFRYGLVHENVLEIELLTGTGDVLKLNQHENKDLFYSVPNSLGTLGYVLKCKMKIIPVKKYIRVEFVRLTDPDEYFAQMERLSKEGEYDFLEGVIFGKSHFVLLNGKMVDDLKPNEKIFKVDQQPWYKYVADRRNDGAVFEVRDYFWRWDSDVFWGTQIKGPVGDCLDNPLLRRTILKGILRSDFLLPLSHRLHYGDLSWVSKLFDGRRMERLVQDAGVEIGKAGKFFLWYKKEIGLYPVWICPVKEPSDTGMYTLYPGQGKYVVDIGFYSNKVLTRGQSDHYYNSLIEAELMRLEAIKGLYSSSFYTPERFWKIYDRARYFKVKSKFDPENVFPDLYAKAVGESK